MVILWRVLAGLLGAIVSLLTLAEVGNPSIRNAAIVALVLGGSLVVSGLPMRQPRWLAMIPGLIILCVGADISRRTTMKIELPVIVGLILILVGVQQPKPTLLSRWPTTK